MRRVGRFARWLWMGWNNLYYFATGVCAGAWLIKSTVGIFTWLGIALVALVMDKRQKPRGAEIHLEGMSDAQAKQVADAIARGLRGE